MATFRVACFLGSLTLVLLAFLPEVLGIGAPGIGPLQGAILVVALGMLVTAIVARVIPARWLLLLASLCLSVSVLLMAVVVMGMNLPWMLWRVQDRILGPHALELHEPDGTLGWRNRADAVASHRHFDFAVHYTTDSSGRRTLENQGPCDSTALLVGGSFTFGHGVEDNETFAAQLVREWRPKICVENGAVNGWGTVQCFLYLQQYLDRNTDRPPDLVVYGWIHSHAQRNLDRASWLEVLDRQGHRKPIVKRDEEGRLVLDRLIGPEFGRPDSAVLDDEELKASIDLVVEMHGLCQLASCNFICLLLPTADGRTAADQRLVQGLSSMNVPYIDLSHMNQDDYHPHDRHPLPVWHAQVAEELKGANLVLQSLNPN